MTAIADMTTITLTFEHVETAPVRPEEADEREFLLWPDAVNEWTIGSWDGAKWCDYTGNAMQPLLWTLLPRGVTIAAGILGVAPGKPGQRPPTDNEVRLLWYVAENLPKYGWIKPLLPPCPPESPGYAEEREQFRAWLAANEETVARWREENASR